MTNSETAAATSSAAELTPGGAPCAPARETQGVPRAEGAPTKTVLLCGVGGQGTILAADILARVAMAEGLDVKLSEIHGMAQRGGAVTTVVRIGEHVDSMVADLGRADCIVAFETTEALRNAAFLRPGGVMLASDESIAPLPVLTGATTMPRGVRASLREMGAHLVPADLLARQAGSAKAGNVVLLGALSAFLPYDAATWLDVVASRVPAKFKDVNLAAFSAGRASVAEAAEAWTAAQGADEARSDGEGGAR